MVEMLQPAIVSVAHVSRIDGKIVGVMNSWVSFKPVGNSCYLKGFVIYI